MPDSNSFIRILLKGKEDYECLLTPQYIIIKVNPENDFLLYKDLRILYRQFKEYMDIEIIGIENPPLLLDQDVYKAFILKNPKLKYLEKKFDCYL